MQRSQQEHVFRDWLEQYDGIIVFVTLSGCFAVIFVFVYWLNQVAVRKELDPRRKELQTLVDSLRATEE